MRLIHLRVLAKHVKKKNLSIANTGKLEEMKNAHVEVVRNLRNVTAINQRNAQLKQVVWSKSFCIYIFNVNPPNDRIYMLKELHYARRI